MRGHGHAPDPKRKQRANHGETGIDAEGLHQRHRRPHGLREIAQMAEQHESQRNVKDPAEQPDPFVGLEQAFENRDFAQYAESRSRPRHRRGRRRDLEGNGRPGVLPYAQSEPGGENRRRNIKHDRVNRGLHANSVPSRLLKNPAADSAERI